MTQPTTNYIIQQLNSDNLSSIQIEEIRLLLYTLEKEELEFLRQEFDSPSRLYTLPFFSNIRHVTRHINNLLAPPPVQRRNESIGELIRLFRDKKSKKVTYSRQQLQERYQHQAFATQRKILDAFLEGTKSDRAWAYRLLFYKWDKHYAAKIASLWETYHEEQCRWIVVKHLSEEYLLKHTEAWDASYSGAPESISNAYKYVCIRLWNNPAFTIDRSRLSEGDYYEVVAKSGGNVNRDAVVDYLFHTIAKQLEDDSLFILPDTFFEKDNSLKGNSIVNILNISSILYNMALLKMSEELICFFEWDSRVQSDFSVRTAGIIADSEKLLAIYIDVVKKHLPLVKNNCSPDEPQPSQCANTPESQISAEEKAAEIEHLCNKNPRFAQMIEKLGLK